jgi:hypothetical protein
MRHMAKAFAAVAVAAVIGASSATAQGVRFGVGGTGLFLLNTGGGSAWGGTALLGFGARESSPVSFRIDATVIHGQGETDIAGSANVLFTFRSAPSSMLHPYVLAGGGVYHLGAVDELTAETKPMVKAGVGVDYRMRSVTLFAEPSILMVFLGSGSPALKFLQATVGVKFGA